MALQNRPPVANRNLIIVEHKIAMSDDAREVSMGKWEFCSSFVWWDVAVNFKWPQTKTHLYFTIFHNILSSLFSVSLLSLRAHSASRFYEGSRKFIITMWKVNMWSLSAMLPALARSYHFLAQLNQSSLRVFSRRVPSCKVLRRSKHSRNSFLMNHHSAA